MHEHPLQMLMYIAKEFSLTKHRSNVMQMESNEQI